MKEAIEWLRSPEGQDWSRFRIRQARRATHSASPSFHGHTSAHGMAEVIAIGLFTIEMAPSQNGAPDIHRAASWAAHDNDRRADGAESSAASH